MIRRVALALLSMNSNRMRLLAIFPCELEDWQILDQLQTDCLSSVFVLPEVAVPLNRIPSEKIRRVSRTELSRASRVELEKSPPDSILWFGRLWSTQALKFLRQLIRLAPESLLTIVLGKEPAHHRHLEEGLLRIGLWLRIIDYVVLGPGTSRISSKLNPQRYSALQTSGDETLTTLLRNRLSAHHRSVLWVDPNLTVGSPSMRSLINSIDSLSADGWSVRGLCFEHAQSASPLEITRLPKLPLPHKLRLLEFFLICNLYRFVQNGLLRRRPARIVHTQSANDLLADLVSLNFCQRRWLEFNAALPIRSWRDRAGLQLSRFYCVLERLQLRSRHVRLLLPASRAIGEAVREIYGLSVPQIVLPNAFDENRFNIAARTRYRESIRLELGFQENVTVFAFTSYGHYRRKGFWLIVEALRILVKQDDLRLLVIGGSPQTLDRLKRDLSQVLIKWSGTWPPQMLFCFPPILKHFVWPRSRLRRWVCLCSSRAIQERR
jgi:glycosyltransferase involved in cell wall biosynthesis